MQEEKKITYTERGGEIKDESGKITHTIFPYKIEGIPMIGEVKRLSAEEFKQAIEDIDTCLMDAPVDFLGTGSDSKAAENNENEWYKKWQSAIKVLREYTQPKALITDAKIENYVDILHKNIDIKQDLPKENIYYESSVLKSFKEYASQSLKGNGFSEEDLRKAMLRTSYETFNNKSIISHRNIDEYIQSLTKPTSAVFTDGEFSHFNY